MDYLLPRQRKLWRDCAVMVWLIKTRLADCKAAMYTFFTGEQYEELTERVEELSDMLYIQLYELYNKLNKTLSWDTGRQEKEIFEFYIQKHP